MARVTPAPANLAIAIVTFNRSTYLRELLASAAAMDASPFRIVVVDNASTDDTQDTIAAATGDFPQAYSSTTASTPTRVARAGSVKAPGSRSSWAPTGCG